MTFDIIFECIINKCEIDKKNPNQNIIDDQNLHV